MNVYVINFFFQLLLLLILLVSVKFPKKQAFRKTDLEQSIFYREMGKLFMSFFSTGKLIVVRQGKRRIDPK
jgi:hypothetical protein